MELGERICFGFVSQSQRVQRYRVPQVAWRSGVPFALVWAFPSSLCRGTKAIPDACELWVKAVALLRYHRSLRRQAHRWIEIAAQERREPPLNLDRNGFPAGAGVAITASTRLLRVSLARSWPDLPRKAHGLFCAGHGPSCKFRRSHVDGRCPLRVISRQI